jgi:hypothetical protein
MTEYDKEQIKEFQRNMSSQKFYLVFHDQLWTRSTKYRNHKKLLKKEYAKCKLNVLKYCQELNPVHMLFIPYRIALYNQGDRLF